MNGFYRLTYREIIEKFLEKHRSIKGYKGLLSNAAGFKPSYLSHILGGSAHLTPDQALLLADFFQLTEHQADYFVTRVNLERASSNRLRDYLQEKISHIERLQDTDDFELQQVKLDFDHALEFFSSWEFPAVYAALQVKGLTSAKSIAARLGIPVEKVENILDRFQLIGMITRDGERWVLNTTNAILLRDHPIIQKMFIHTLNIRSQLAMDMQPEKAVKWCGGFYSVTESDMEDFNAKLLKLYEEFLIKSGRGEKTKVMGISLGTFEV